MKQQFSGFLLQWFALLAIGAALSMAAAPMSLKAIDDRLRIVLLLDEDGSYSAIDLAQQLNEHLGEQLDLDALKEVRQSILPAELALLRLLSATNDNFHFEMSDVELTMSFKRSESNETHRILKGLMPRSLPTDAELYRIVLPSPVDQTDRIVLLIHGLGSSPASFRNLSKALIDHGFTIAFYEYPRDAPPELAAKMLSEHLKVLAANQPEVTVDIVAHSLGGLIARRVVEDPDFNPGNVQRLLLMAVPHGGSNLAALRSMWELVRLIELDADLSGVGLDFVGPPGRDLLPGSPFLKRLESQERSATVEYHQLVGTRAPFSKEQWSALVEQVRLRLNERDVAPWVRASVLGTLQSLDEVQTGRGDEAVSISSAILSGAPEPIHVPFSHREIQQLRQVEPVEEHPVFQWIIGRLSLPISNLVEEPQS